MEFSEFDAKELGFRIRFLRESLGIEEVDLAKELGLPTETYLEYEKDGKNIPISIIYELSRKFKVDFNEILTGTEAKLNTYHIVRHKQGRQIERYPGYNFQDLAFRYSNKLMQPLLVNLLPSDEPTTLVSHKGQEFNMVLEGKIKLIFDQKELILEQGDSIYFNPLHPHGQRAVDGPSTFLTVICE